MKLYVIFEIIETNTNDNFNTLKIRVILTHSNRNRVASLTCDEGLMREFARFNT